MRLPHFQRIFSDRSRSRKQACEAGNPTSTNFVMRSIDPESGKKSALASMRQPRIHLATCDVSFDRDSISLPDRSTTAVRATAGCTAASAHATAAARASTTTYAPTARTT